MVVTGLGDGPSVAPSEISASAVSASDGAVRAALVRVLSPAQELTPATPLADVGADSLALAEVADLVEAALPGVRLDDTALAACRTVGDLERHVRERA